MKIAVLLTTRNRKQKTLACIESLKSQSLPATIRLDVHLTDDGSSDGTMDGVKLSLPSATLYTGSGSLFWAGGMRYTWRRALNGNYDYYLLLNDDTVLASNAISSLLMAGETYSGTNPVICIGNTKDPHTGERSYGGRKLTSKKSWKDDLVVFSETEYLPCDVANANIMLVPAKVVEKIGILSESYTHGLADYDYTLKAKKAGIEVLVAPGYLGTCVNDHGNNWKSHNTTLKERIAYMRSPKGLAYGEYMTFIKRHFPFSYPSAFIKIWMKTLFPFIWETYRK